MRLRTQQGQASAEYVAVVAVVAGAFAALVAMGAPSGAAGDLGSAICDAAGFCGGGGAPAELTAVALTPADERALVDRYLDVDLGEFLAYRDSPYRDPSLDWSTDLCSAPVVGSRGESFDFSDPCLRHDFGYRNYDRLGLFEQRREAVDDRFLDDMRGHCETRRWWSRLRCETWAEAFHLAVRTVGGLSH